MAEQQRIFLGHTSEDKPRVRELYHRLKSRGFDPWLDAIDLILWQHWRVEVPKAIQQAGVFLICLSKQSVAKESHDQQEFRYSLVSYAERDPDSIVLIPVLLDDCEVPDIRLPELGRNLRDLHWLNLFEDEGFERLVGTIERALANISAGPVPASVSAKEALGQQEASVPAPEPQPSRAPLQELKRLSNAAIKPFWIGAGSVAVVGLLTVSWLMQTPNEREQAVVPTDVELPEDGGPTPVVEPEKPVAEDVGASTNSLKPETEPTLRPNESRVAGLTNTNRQPFEAFRDCDQAPCPDMIMLPAGTFMMGSPADEEGRYNREGPQHQVTITRPFAIGKYEVTFAEYDQFAEATDRQKPDDRSWGRGRQPVINVSWHEANAYCTWLGKGYRLPTEAEWEYAARAGKSTRYSFGDQITQEQAKFGIDRSHGSTAEVGSYPANDWGLHDMHGNVWEWVSDWYDDYTIRSMTDPTGPAIGTDRVVRGGAWLGHARSACSACRNWIEPGYRLSFLGFRCVRL